MSRCAVVIPCFNAAPWIERAILSVLSQQIQDLSVIVCDDGSTDNSVEIIKKFGSPVKIIEGPNLGACHARNQGFNIAKTQGATHVLFLDADDYHQGSILSGSLTIAERHNADIVVSDMHIETEVDGLISRPRYQGYISPEDLFSGWMAGDYVNPSAILWRSDFLEHIKGWDETLARAQDLEIVLRAMFFNPTIWKNDTGAAIHAQVNACSISRTQSNAALQSRYFAVSGILQRSKNTQFAHHNETLCRELYHIARAAFRAKNRTLGREILAALAEEKFVDHPGTKLHAVAARTLGLETKVRLWRA